MKNYLILLSLFTGLLFSCQPTTAPEVSKADASLTNYLDNTGKEDRFMGGVKMVKVNTPKGDFKVWTKRVGNNPKMKVLLLHGGPGMTHEIYECFDGYFPQEGIEYY